MSAINQNQDLQITQNKDGSFTMNWNRDDPNWNFLNNLTSEEISNIIKEEIQNYGKQNVERNERSGDGECKNCVCS